MTDIIIETIRAIIVVGILLYLWIIGRKADIHKQKGWSYVLTGFFFLLLGMIVDITDNFPVLNKYIIIGDTKYEAFLEKVVGYLFGFLLLAIGFWKWIPTVATLNETKNALKESLDALAIKNRELEQVLYVTSHDLRSPLVNIEGYSKELNNSLNELMSSIENEQVPQSIKDKITPIIKEDIPESLHYILTSVTKMNTLLKGILTLSRLGRLELKVEDIDMNTLMADIVDSHRFRLNELSIKTEVSKLPNCKGDSSQLNQVFSNLLDNAIKYSDSGRPCFVKISGYKDKEQSVCCIEDNGIGVAQEHQNKIFEIFHQLEPNIFKGEGMGLTIAHRIIEKHNGNILVESELGKGSKFIVSLPS